jgi:hypothetical protein
MLAAVELAGGGTGGAGRALVQVVAGSAAGLVAFVVAARLLGVEELDALARLLPGRARRRLGLG